MDKSNMSLEDLKSCLEDPKCQEFVRTECEHQQRAKGQGVAAFDWGTAFTILAMVLDAVKKWATTTTEGAAKASASQGKS